MNWHVVTPAYGRDYRNKKSAEADFKAGKDFKLESQGGCYCSIRDFQAGDSIEIRYAKQMKLTVVKI